MLDAYYPVVEILPCRVLSSVLPIQLMMQRCSLVSSKQPNRESKHTALKTITTEPSLADSKHTCSLLHLGEISQPLRLKAYAYSLPISPLTTTSWECAVSAAEFSSICPQSDSLRRLETCTDPTRLCTRDGAPFKSVYSANEGPPNATRRGSPDDGRAVAG